MLAEVAVDCVQDLRIVVDGENDGLGHLSIGSIEEEEPQGEGPNGAKFLW
jgi:hypothetical protein